jgi:hypothetical protein
MKVSELFEARGWAADMARENRERNRKARDAAKAEEKERKAQEKSRVTASTKKRNEQFSSGAIFRYVSDKISQAFPDGEPEFHQWMDKYGVTMKDVDKAFKQHSGAKSYDDYMRTMWDESADQVISDMKMEYGYLNPKLSPDETIKIILSAVKHDHPGQARHMIELARRRGKDNPEFKAIEKSIGDKGRVEGPPHSAFYDYDNKTGEFTKAPNPYK